MEGEDWAAKSLTLLVRYQRELQRNVEEPSSYESSICLPLSTYDGTLSHKCMNSSFSRSHPCRILQRYTIFVESNMNSLTFLKSPNNVFCHRSNSERDFIASSAR